MSLPIPLTVRLSTSRNPSRDITAEVRDLTCRWTDPGGFSSCQVALDRPLSLQPDEIAYYGQMTVYDGRNGSVVWDGRMEDPGRSAGQDGQVWDLVAVGGQAHTKDRTVPLIYIDRQMTYERVDNATPGGRDSIGASPGDAAGMDQNLILQWPQGLTVDQSSRVVMRYNPIWRAGQKLARFAYTWDAGLTDANSLVQAVTRTDGSLAAGENAASTAWNTAGGTASGVIITNFTSGRNTVEFRIFRNIAGAFTVPNDTYWVTFANVIIQATRYNKSGTELLTAADYPGDTILASDVVADLLGRLLTAYDGANASIATTSYAIDQLAYPDGVDASKVLTDLQTLEFGYTWRVWERNSAGKYRFEFVAVPSTVRYEADILDGYDSQGSADGLYNQVTVRGRDAAGHIKTITRTSTVPELDAAGLIRTPPGPIDLGDEVWSTANAQRAGDQFLADHRYPPNAGRLRIARKILDLQTGRMVEPWEIRPGLIRVRGILPRIDALNATARDGVTIFRIASSEYRVSDAAATLELDSYAPSTARALADLSRRPVYRRR